MLKDNQAKKNNNNKKIYILAYPLQIIKKKRFFTLSYGFKTAMTTTRLLIRNHASKNVK